MLHLASQAREESTHRVGGRIVAIVLHYNGLNDTLDCLTSLSQANRQGVEVIVVDNASDSDPTHAICSAHPWCQVIRNGKNGGWAGGNNLGIEHARQAGAEWIMLLNNDTIIGAQIFDRMRAAVESFPEFAILGPVINDYAPADRVQTQGCRFNQPTSDALLSGHPVAFQSSDSPVVTQTDIVNGCCIMIRRDVFDRIGLIDERFFLVHEESDFCLRAIEAGFACGVLGESLVWHKHSSSFARAGKPLQVYYSTRNSWLLAAKHPEWPQARKVWATRGLLLRHTWYAYAREREYGNPAGARAALEGFVDAWLRRFGQRRGEVKGLVTILDGLAFALWRLRGGKEHAGAHGSIPQKVTES